MKEENDRVVIGDYGGEEKKKLHEHFLHRLTQDVIFEQFPNEEFGALRTLDFPQCGLKIVDLSPVTAFDNLARLVFLHITS